MLVRLGEPPVEVELRRNARARRFTLTVPQAGGPPRLTMPKYASEREARAFLSKQGDWLRGAMARRPGEVIVGIGSRIPVEGRLRTVVAMPGRRLPPVAHGDALVLTGGAPDEAGRRIEAWLKLSARTRLAAISEAAAGRIGARVARIALRDTRGRWGSCSSRGNLNFSWRLAMAPAHVLDYVAVHEAAHLVEMNHGPRFWALVERLRPDWRTSRDWLRREGASLHRYRFSAAE